MFIFFNLFICFNWSAITSHYGGPCHTSTWISYGHTGALPSWTPLPPPSPPHPSGLFQSTSFECPASCIELSLVIYFTYGNIHDSVLVSHIIPPLPSRSVPTSLFSMFVSPLLPLIGSQYHFSRFYIYVLICNTCFSFSLTTLCIIGSRFILLIRTDSNTFLCIAK